METVRIERIIITIETMRIARLGPTRYMLAPILQNSRLGPCLLSSYVVSAYENGCCECCLVGLSCSYCCQGRVSDSYNAQMPASDMREGASPLPKWKQLGGKRWEGKFQIFNSNLELGLLEATDCPRALQVEIAFRLDS